MTKDEALRMALEALEKIASSDYRGNRSNESVIAFKTLTAIKESLAQTQEPMATLFGNLPVYDTTPPQRTWVGLTDDEMYEAVRTICKADSVARSLFDISKDEYRAIEAKLKEKNT